MQDLAQWMFLNLMVVMGLAFIGAYPPVFGRIQNTERFPWRDLVAFTLMAVSCVLFPWDIMPGVQADLRAAPVSLLGWLHGPLPAAISAVVVLLARLWRGGEGMAAAVMNMVVALAMVPIFRRLKRTMPWLMLLGLMHFVSLYISFLLFKDIREQLPPLSPMWVVIAAVFTVGPTLVNAAVEHVQEKHRLQLELAQELRTKAAVLELIPYAVMLLDGAWKLVGSNQAAQDLNQQQILRATLATADVAGALQARRPLREVRVSCDQTDGAVFLVSVEPLDQGGALIGIQNVTTLVQQERQVATQERLQLLGHLASMAAHEIKNPLTTIKGFLQLLSERPEFAPHRGTFALVQGEVEHINRVVRDFLALSHPTVHTATTFDLDGLLLDLLAVMGLQYPSAGVEIALVGTPGLTFSADRKALKQILQNLMANAYEAMTDGGTLQIHREQVGDRILISIADNGPGIAPDILPLIFQPHTTTKVTGTGLGLAISHKLASEMRGTLEVASEYGKGSTFRLTLPSI